MNVMARDPKKALVVIPTYNEIENLPELVEGVFQYLPECEVLIIDDDSPDGTGRWCDEYARTDRRLTCLHREEKLGLGSALLAAMRFALENDYTFTMTMDADLSHPPRYLPDILAKIDVAEKPQVDVVIGSRYIAGGTIRGWSFWRRLMSFAVNFFSRLLLGLKVRDCSSGFRCYRTKVLTRIDSGQIRSKGYSFEEEILWQLHRQGAHFAEIPFTFVDRGKGTTKISIKEAIAAGGVILVLALDRLSGCRRKQKTDPC